MHTAAARGSALFSALRHFAMLAAALLPGVACADPVLPAAVYSASACLSFGMGVGPGANIATGAAPGVYIEDDGAILFLSAVPSPAIGAQAVAPGNVNQLCDNGFEAEAVGQIRYSYAVIGPLAGVAVPLIVTYRLTASEITPLGGFEAALAIISGVDGGLGGLHDEVCAFQVASGTDCIPSTGGVNPTPPQDPFPFTAISGTVYGVDLYAQAFAGGNVVGGSANAGVDPFIYVDPAFLAANPGYSVVVSDGIGNAPSVPEPDTLALLGLGLAGLGFSRRARVSRKVLVRNHLTRNRRDSN